MAKLYGNRWQTVDGPHLGQGGQGEVFRVIDITGEHPGEFALKRIRNPKRRARFEHEIEAIKLLQHPNIVQLVDHSALEKTGGNAEKPFLVMPLAHGGDLSVPARIANYNGNLDSTLAVAKQLARGLAHAHANGVIHRDIKPENILFPGIGHNTWVSDFGICLLRDAPPVTASDEVMGPRHFTAPELEGGGKLDVTPAADIYSLGKVIYYMISGGVILPRERLREVQYQEILKNGQRYQLLGFLLEKMICPLATRLQIIDAVITELDRIEEWERNISLIPVSAGGLDAISQLRQGEIATVRAREANTANRQETERRFSAVSDSVLKWLRSELTKVACHLGDETALRMEVRDAAMPDVGNMFKVQTSISSSYCSVCGIELSLQGAGDGFQQSHLLKVLLCREFKVVVSSHVAGRQPNLPEPVKPPEDVRLALIPVYCNSARERWVGYLSRPEKIDVPGRPPQQPRMSSQRVRSGLRLPPDVVGRSRVNPLMASFHYDATQIMRFRVSEWPKRQEELRTALTTAVDSFLNVVKSGNWLTDH